MRAGVVLVAVALLSGCGERAYIQYQGREAQTALECEAGYAAAKEQQSNPVVGVTSGAGLAAAALTVGIVRGATESAYEACLARVANLPPGSVPASATPPLQSTGATPTPPVSARPTGCVPGGGPFQGGTGYCAGR